MDKLFVDANKYLDFYRVNEESMITALDELAKVSKNLFVTRQISDEFHRRKLGVAMETLKKYQDAFNGIQWSPEPWFLGSEISAKGGRKIIKHDSRKLALERRIGEHLESIEKSKDEISVSLDPIFGQLAVHTHAQ